jgi:hypothetical protein
MHRSEGVSRHLWGRSLSGDSYKRHIFVVWTTILSFPVAFRFVLVLLLVLFLGFCVVVSMVDLRQSSHVLTRCCLSTSPRSQWICNCANESNAMTLWSLNIPYQATSVLDQGSDDTSMGCFCMDPGNNDLTYASFHLWATHLGSYLIVHNAICVIIGDGGRV